MSLKGCWEEIAIDRGEEEIEQFMSRKLGEKSGRSDPHIIP